MASKLTPGTTLFKDDIIAAAADNSLIKEEAFEADPKLMAKAFEAIMNAIEDQVSQGARVRITGFGMWELADRAPRTARNPHTGEPVEVPATVKVRFKVGAGFAGLVKQRAAQR
ncbi:HU family DNA-binding protein [Streptosporangium sp. NPDC049248]|uniref:HU family DNA-binding protein n=1 Tax=Streptosporangium sp. NPDC049248 TaxID=3155651 RepID=UPI003428A944